MSDKIECSFCHKVVEKAECLVYPALVQERDYDYYCHECQESVSFVVPYLKSREKHDPMDDDPNRYRE